jgi:hypothetical protein
LAIANQLAHHDHHAHHLCDHHAADSSTPSNGEKPCDHPCGEGACSFIAASKVILPDLAQPAGIVASDAVTLLYQLAPSCVATDHHFDRAIKPPVRSHLSKCVLLV